LENELIKSERCLSEKVTCNSDKKIQQCIKSTKHKAAYVLGTKNCHALHVRKMADTTLRGSFAGIRRQMCFHEKASTRLAMSDI
jgi:hypothetical protein